MGLCCHFTPVNSFTPEFMKWTLLPSNLVTSIVANGESKSKTEWLTVHIQMRRLMPSDMDLHCSQLFEGNRHTFKGGGNFRNRFCVPVRKCLV